MQTNTTEPECSGPSRKPIRALVCTLLAAGVVLSTGCRSNKRYDLLEAELRTRERELADTRTALDQSRNLLRAYEVGQQRGAVGSTPHTSGPFLPVKEIALGRGTGGVNADGEPGDDGLMVVIVPKDEDGSAVKVPARALVAAWEITPAGLKNPIGSWEVPSDKLRRTWKSGIISSGYFLTVPWQTPPATDKVRVAVRLVTSDGRTYEADRDVAVRPIGPPRGNILPYPQPAVGEPGGDPRPPGGGRQPLHPDPAPPGLPSVVPPGTEELPPPTPSGGDRGARLLPPVKL